VAANIQLLGIQPGTDSKISTSIETMVGETWGTSRNLANVAVVTLKTSVTMASDGSTVNVSIQPAYYTYPDGLGVTKGFCIGSVTKSFTGTMLAWRIAHTNATAGDPLDQEQGGGPTRPNYNLHAPVSQWLPDEVQKSKNRISTVTLGQLATMSSCLKNNLPATSKPDFGLYNGKANPPDGVAPCQQQIDAWCDDTNWYETNKCTQGTAAHYSNWGTITLAFAVSQPNRTPYDYDESLATMISTRLGLSSATNSDIATNVGKGYGKDNKEATGKAHGIRSTIGDMSLFVGGYLYYMMMTMYADLQINTTDRYWARITKIALTAPYPGVNWALEWQTGSLAVGRKNFPRWFKNGMTGAQGFSSYVEFAQMATPAPAVTPLGQVGVIVLVNKNMQQSHPNPAAYGRAVNNYLVGNTTKPTWDPQPDPADELDDDDPVGDDAAS
jgi:CubicO group peptidase (beta-lactamase class C family)